MQGLWKFIPQALLQKHNYFSFFFLTFKKVFVMGSFKNKQN